MVESYLSSIENLDAKNVRPSFSSEKLNERFGSHFGLYLLVVNYLAKEIFKEEIFAENEKNKICEYFGIPEAESLALERSDTNAIIAKIYEYRLDNLKDIFFLLHLKNLFVASPDKDLSNANTILNLIIRELILLDHKFSHIDEPNLETLNFTKMSSMKEVLHSDLVNNFFLLCACYCRDLSDKIHLEKQLEIKHNKIQPVKKLLTFLPQDKKFAKYYFNFSDNSLLKFYFEVLAADFAYNAKIYDFIHRQDKKQLVISPEPDKLKKPLKEMIDYLNYINSTSSDQGNSSESLDPTQILALKQNMFFRFKGVIKKLMSNLSQLVPIEEFKNSLAEKIQDYGLDRNEIVIFLEDLFKEWESKDIVKYARFELEYGILIFFSENTTEQIRKKLNKLVDSLKQKLKSKLNEDENIACVNYINYRNQQEQYRIFYNKFSKKTSLTESEIEDITKLREKFLNIEKVETESEPAFLEHTAEAKDILLQCLFLTDKETKELENFAPKYPYYNRIAKCYECLKWFKENLAKKLCTEKTKLNKAKRRKLK